MPLSRSLLAVAVITLVGCGRGETLHPVAGKVFLNGAPLAGGPRCYVVFVPDRAKGNASPHEPKATIGADGTYTLETVDKPGCLAGWYRVRVDAPDMIDPKTPYTTKWLAPPKYADVQTSGLTAEVVAQPAAGAYDLKLSK